MRVDRRLLGAHDPAPFQVERPDAESPFVLACDHAGRAIPTALGSLEVAPSDLDRHIAWDIGAAGLARGISERLDAWLILQTYSRLVIDANRPLDSPESIVRVSDGTRIAGNDDLTQSAIELRRREIFAPYHERLATELDARSRAARSSVLVSIHSFTPSFAGRSRPWHAGVLYGRDARLARAVLEVLGREPGLVIGDNEPYSVDDASDYTVLVHGERRGLEHVELEIRQDLIANASGQAEWADRLAQVLTRAIERR